jgi:FlaA1/EpsC-like NDP-sugar epimerase
VKNNQELLIDPTQSQPTQHHHILSYEEPLPEANVLEKEISILTEAIERLDVSAALASMKQLVPEYNHENGQ